MGALARPVAAGPVTVDLDATITLALSAKELAAPTFKPTFGFHPLLAVVGCGLGTGPAVVGNCWPGCCGPVGQREHRRRSLAVLDLALAQLRDADRSRVLVRGDAGTGTTAFLQ